MTEPQKRKSWPGYLLVDICWLHLKPPNISCCLNRQNHQMIASGFKD